MTNRILEAIKLVCVLSVVSILAGCAFGRTYSYADAPISLQGVASSGTIAVGVQDARSYVTSGGKPEKFVGLMRGGFGNPFDVNTQSGTPLAVEMRDALAKSLKAKGATVSSVVISPSETASRAKRALMATNSRRLVLITLNEWKSDTMMNTSLYYDVKLDVMDEMGNSLATNQVKGSDNLGSLGLSPNAGIGASFVKKLDTLFDDEKVISVLK
jgi:hypothetical protein